MTSSKDEREALADFASRYSIGPSNLLDEIEQLVIGDVWGANGFTTRAQADRLGDALGLGADDHLLDIGSGRGWPGLYLAKRSGCRVTLTDLPLEGLEVAGRRAGAEDVGFTGAVVASAKRLPFAGGSFDAVVHTDVLC